VKGTALYLASASPRRRRLLVEAGFEPVVVRSGVDDSQLTHGAAGPAQWSAALAYLKAWAGWRRLRREPPDGPGVVLGADTIVVRDGEVIGQPSDAEHARAIVRRLERGEHAVITGVALLRTDATPSHWRAIFADEADVEVGEIGAERIGAYVDSGDWAGKAGAYNLSERVEAGWPIAHEGDPGTIMGLPMRRLTPLLERLGVRRVEAGSARATEA